MARVILVNWVQCRWNWLTPEAKKSILLFTKFCQILENIFILIHGCKLRQKSTSDWKKSGPSNILAPLSTNAQGSYCDRSLSVLVSHLSTFSLQRHLHLNHWDMLIKLRRDVPCMKFFKNCSKNFIPRRTPKKKPLTSSSPKPQGLGFWYFKIVQMMTLETKLVTPRGSIVFFICIYSKHLNILLLWIHNG